MAEGSFPQLLAIMKRLDGESWSRLEPFQLPILRSLHHTWINYPLLHTLAQFWDVRKHVFWFGTVELCPLPEEFEALLGCNLDPTCQLAVPRLRSPDPHTILYQLRTLYGQSSRTSACSIVGSEIRLESLIEILRDIGTAEDHWPRVMALCFYLCLILGTATQRSSISWIRWRTGLIPSPLFWQKPLLVWTTLLHLSDFQVARCYWR